MCERLATFSESHRVLRHLDENAPAEIFWNEDQVNVKRIQHGLYHEDFEVGQRFSHHWGRTFTESDAIWYSNFTMQYNPIYFNRIESKRHGYDDILIHPLFVFTTALGLSVEDLTEAGGPFLGIDDLHHCASVYPGDTIRAYSEVLSSRLTKSRPGWGIVEWQTHAVNQDGIRVVEFRRRNLSKSRQPGIDHGHSAG